MRAAWKHFRTVCKHKWIVFSLMCRCGYPWQGFMHDLSKFSPAEFLPSARYFQGDKSPIEAEKAKVGYSAAWMYHKGHNPHHWEYWVDFGKAGEPIPARIPYRYVIEMICDYVAAGMVYSKGTWTQEEPLAYFERVRAGRHFHTETVKMLRLFLGIIADEGLTRFCYCARHNRWRKEGPDQ